MSGRLVVLSTGLGLMDEDLERLTEALAGADDAALAAIAQPRATAGAAVKRILPLLDEMRPVPGGGSPVPALRTPRALVAEAAYYDGTSIGKVRVQPHIFEVWGAASANPSAQAPSLRGFCFEPLDTPNFASSVSGRVDTVYLTVRFNAGTTASRRVKDPTSGVVSTQTVTLYQDPEVTIHVSPGAEGSSTPGAVPADGAGSYNVGVAQVSLPVGYTSGGALFDGGGSFIEPTWERARLNEGAVGGARHGVVTGTSGADTGPADRYTRALATSRFAGRQMLRACFRHTASTAVVVLDDSIDWRLREVNLTCLRSVSHTPAGSYGNWVPPTKALTGGGAMSESSGWVHSGYVNDTGTGVGAFFETSGAGGDPVLKFFARNSDGALVATIAAAPLDGAHGGDFYTVLVDYLDANEEP